MLFKRVIFLCLTLCPMFSCKTQEGGRGQAESATASGSVDASDSSAPASQITLQANQIEKILVVSDKANGLGLDQEQEQGLIVGGAITAALGAAIVGVFMMKGRGSKKPVDAPPEIQYREEVVRVEPVKAKSVKTEIRPVVEERIVEVKPVVNKDQTITVKINNEDHKISFETIREEDTAVMFSVRDRNSNVVVHEENPSKIDALFETLKKRYSVTGINSDDTLVAFVVDGKTYLVEGGNGRMTISNAKLVNFKNNFDAKASKYFPKNDSAPLYLRNEGYIGATKVSDQPLTYTATKNGAEVKVQVDTEYVVSTTNSTIYKKFTITEVQ